MHSNVDLSFDLFYLKMCRESIHTPTQFCLRLCLCLCLRVPRSLTNYLSEQNFPNCRMHSINVTLSRKIGCFLILAGSCLNVLKRATFSVSFNGYDFINSGKFFTPRNNFCSEIKLRFKITLVTEIFP